MQLRWHFLKDLVHKGLVTIQKVPTAGNIADMMTKALPRQLLHRCLVLGGCWHLPEVERRGEEEEDGQEESIELNLVTVNDYELETSALQARTLTTPSRRSETPLILNVYVVMFFIGLASGMWLWRTCTRQSTVRTRTVGTQSQVTYTALANHVNPRFQPLPERAQGAFAADGLPLS